MKPKTLALDLGTQFVGWAIGSPDERPYWGTHLMPKVTQDDLVTLMVDLRSFLHSWNHDLNMIVYEAPVMVGTNNPYSIRKVSALGGMVELFGHDNKIAVLEASIGSVRRHFLGKGMTPRKSNEQKAAVMARCRMMGLPCRTDHEADALAILDYSLSVRGAALRLWK